MALYCILISSNWRLGGSASTAWSNGLGNKKISFACASRSKKNWCWNYSSENISALPSEDPLFFSSVLAYVCTGNKKIKCYMWHMRGCCQVWSVLVQLAGRPAVVWWQSPQTSSAATMTALTAGKHRQMRGDEHGCAATKLTYERWNLKAS